MTSRRQTSLILAAAACWLVAPVAAGELPAYYQLTSRPCPPNCVTPFAPHPEVTVVGELELQRILHKDDVLVIDSRRPEVFRRTGSIPGAIHIPFYEIGLRYGADPIRHERHLKQFGLNRIDGRTWDFSSAKKLVFLDDGIWDGAVLRNIRTLLSLGYPAKKLYWYRGGMNDWVGLGLATVRDNHDR